MFSAANLIFAPHSWESYAKSQLSTSAETELIRRELARRHILDYIKYLFPDYIAESFNVRVCNEIMWWLDEIIAGNDPNLIIEAPPRHGKSFICSDHLPTFAAGYFHSHGIRAPQIIHTGYSQTFIEKFGKRNRDRFLSIQYSNIFPECSADKNAASVNDVQLINGGGYFASGMHGAITGLGGHALIIDDPIKGSEEANSESELRKQLEWYMSVLSSRGMEKVGKLIIMTRWSKADLAGQVQRIAKENNEADQWRVLTFPAIAVDNDILSRKPGEPLCPRRFPLKRLRRERAGKSAKVWSALYQQNPVPESGGFFEASEIEECITPLSSFPPLDKLTIYVGGDFAIGTKAKNDWTVLWPFGVDTHNHIWFLNDVRRFKGGGNDIVKAIISLGRKYNPRSFILEDGHIFRGFRDLLDLRMRESGNIYHIDAPYPTKDKLARAEPLRARMQQRLVHFPDSTMMKDLVFGEMLAFGEDGVGVHDDTVDAMATGVMRMNHLRGKSAPRAKKTTVPTRTPYDEWTMDDLKLYAEQSERQRARRSMVAKAPNYLNGRERRCIKPTTK
jgi:predicted phage terminase large subunit-like protein